MSTGKSTQGDLTQTAKEESFAQQFTAVNEKLDRLASSVEILATKVQELLTFKDSVGKIENSIQVVQTSIEFLSTKYDSVLETVNKIRRRWRNYVPRLTRCLLPSSYSQT